MLREKTAVVTGANRGIGNAIIRRFLKEDASVIACIRNPDEEEWIRQETQLIEEYHGKLSTVKLDLSQPDSIKSAVSSFYKQGNNIDILINNAGITYNAPQAMTSLKTYHHIFETNFFSMVDFTNRILRKMIMKKKGCIVNMASFAGENRVTGLSAYGASKAAVSSYTRTLAAEYGGYGIRANAVAPGVIDTKMVSETMEKAAIERMMLHTAMGRMGTPEEVAGVVLFLASDLASYVNGQVIMVDGGRLDS